MNELFNYSTIDVGLSRPTRTLNIHFKEGTDHITLESLFELESVLAWASNRVEIRSIFISSRNEFFSEGIDKQKLANMSAKKLVKMSQKLQTIVHAMFHLPQTIILDMGMGSFDIASELALGADIRICSKGAMIAFNHNRVGLTPSSGGIGFLSVIVGQAMARNWTLTGKEISSSQLLMSGFISEQYDSTNRDECVEALLEAVYNAAPVQRIQTKLGLLENARLEFERAKHYERKLSEAAMTSEDWKEREGEFMKAKSMSTSVKLSIVKDREERETEKNPH